MFGWRKRKMISMADYDAMCERYEREISGLKAITAAALHAVSAQMNDTAAKDELMAAMTELIGTTRHGKKLN
jgi:hypothetical protein